MDVAILTGIIAVFAVVVLAIFGEPLVDLWTTLKSSKKKDQEKYADGVYLGRLVDTNTGRVDGIVIYINDNIADFPDIRHHPVLAGKELSGYQKITRKDEYRFTVEKMYPYKCIVMNKDSLDKISQLVEK